MQQEDQTERRGTRGGVKTALVILGGRDLGALKGEPLARGTASTKD